MRSSVFQELEARRIHKSRSSAAFMLLYRVSMASRHPLSHIAFADIWKFLRNPKSPLLPKVIAMLAILYLLWPIDLIPDMAPILGWLDDIGIISLAIWYLRQQVTQHQNLNQP